MSYVNVHGKPLEVSARDAVLSTVPGAVCAKAGGWLWIVRKTKHRYAAEIGTGANEEAAWRDAWSRMLVESMGSEQESSRG